MEIRAARLDDTRAISKLFCSQISTWQRLDEQGHVQDLSYDELSIYDRWLHGGPWMSIETSAIWLNHLLNNRYMPLVAIGDRNILAYAEVYEGNEPPPFGKHLHIGHLVCHENDSDLRDQFMEYLFNFANENKYAQVTVAFSGHDAEQVAYYSNWGLQELVRIGRFTIPAQTGQGFYKTTSHPNADPKQIDGWQMIAGRLQSARQQWEELWPPLWNALDEIRRRRLHRIHFSASGQNALVACQQHLYDPRNAEIFCWSPMPLKGQLVTAISDWAHRENYRRLTFSIPEQVTKVLGADAETHPYQQVIYALDISESNEQT